jgi:hypothetical protein
MNERSAAKWKTRRNMGQEKYAMIYGSLGIGFTIAFLLCLVEYFNFGTLDYWFAIIRFCVGGVIGFIVGISLWNSKEAKYREYTNSHPSSE